MTAPAVERVVFCGRCGTIYERRQRLFARWRDGFCCVECWKALSSPFPRAAVAPELVHQAEIAARERMTARGGTDRHLVRNGRT